MFGSIRYSFFLVVVLTFEIYKCQKVQDHYYRTALFAKPEVIQRADELYRKVSQNVTTPMDKTVEHILQWLQSRYNQKNRIIREESSTSRSPNYTMKPQPFALTRSLEDTANNGYQIYDTYPTPAFYPYNQTQNPSTASSQFENILQNPTEPPQFTYYAPDENTSETKSESPDDNFLSIQDALTEEATTLNSLLSESPTKVQENSASNELEPYTGTHPPHIHSIDVQCFKDKMVINIEFNEIYNGIIYSKGYYNDSNCHYVMKDSGQIKYSFVVQLNSCGTQFIDEFYKGKQAFLENVLVLQNEPGIQEVWDTIRSVRCLWEGSIKQTLQAGLNVETLNQDILTFSGDMISARLEIQVGKGPNAPSTNGLVKIGETMTLVVTVDGDSTFDILVKSCIATDGNPNSGNLIQLTDDQGCILKPKLFGNFQMIKNPDPNRPSVVSYAYFQAFKFPDIMDLLIECNVELCKTQCQGCPQQNTEAVRQKRLISSANSYVENTTKFLSEKLHVFTPDDIRFVATNYGDLSPDETQVCVSMTIFYLQNTVAAMFFFISIITIICFWLKLKKFTEKSILY